MDYSIVNDVLAALQGHSIGEFLITLLSNSSYLDCPLRILFLGEWPDLLQTLADLPTLRQSTAAFSKHAHTRCLVSEVASLANKESGWHFSAMHARAEQIESFSMEDMARKLRFQAPGIWDLLGSLLDSDPSRTRRRKQHMDPQAGRANGGAAPRSQGDAFPEEQAEAGRWDEEDEYWAQVEQDLWDEDGARDENDLRETEAMGQQGASASARPAKRARLAAGRRTALLQIVSSHSFYLMDCY